MNKFIYMVMSLLLVAAVMTGCGNYNAGKPSNTPNVEGSPVVTTQPAKETENNEEAMQSFRFSLIKYFCNVPETYGRRTNGRIAIAIGKDEYIATIYTGDVDAYTGNLEGILAFAANEYSRDTAAYLLADLDPAELKANKTEKVTVSGYDAVKFSCPVKNKSGNTYEIYGYSMIIDGRPIMFLGVLCSDDQAAEDFNDMKDLIDLMAGSIYK